MKAHVRAIAPAVVLLIVVTGLVGMFAVDPSSTSPEPVDVDKTVSMGVEFDDDERADAPAVQVFYSQYPYVVSYYGVETFVHEQRQDAHEQRFGYPLAIYVTDYSAAAVSLTSDGAPVTAGDVRWARAEDIHYVVGSDARLPSGETVMPFADRSVAEQYASDHGGEVVTWDDVTNREFEIDDAGTVRDRVDSQRRDADALVESAESSLDRPRSVVVGEDAETIQEAVDAAPAETTVVVPPGRYDETITIDRPLTLRGEPGARIHGDGNGTPLSVEADDVAVAGVEVTGVGSATDDDLLGHDHSGDEAVHDHGGDEDDEEEDGDAGIAVVDSRAVLVRDVIVETPSTGVFLRDSPDAVVRNVTVEGADNWRDGFMGVLAIRSPGVIEESTLRGGRDAVYSHRSDGLVVRNSTITDGRIGVHFMHTSNALVADNVFRGQSSAGIYVMTGPEYNAIVGNDVRGVPTGIAQGGSSSYLAKNVLMENEVGIESDATASIYERNAVASNEVGIVARSVIPSNRVVDNDFVENDRHARTWFGPLRTWSYDGAGNYWEGAIGSPEGGVLDRTYTTTHPVDSRLHRVDGTGTLARAPVLDAISGLEGTSPGMRSEQIVDTAPRCEPVSADRLEELRVDATRTEFADDCNASVRDRTTSQTHTDD